MSEEGGRKTRIAWDGVGLGQSGIEGKTGRIRLHFYCYHLAWAFEQGFFSSHEQSKAFTCPLTTMNSLL